MALVSCTPNSEHAIECPNTTSFKCHICLEDVPISSGVALGSCGDRFCLPCVHSLLSFVVSERSIVPVPCPICRAPLDNEACLKILAESKNHEKTFTLFAEMAALSAHSRLRYCSNERCGAPFDWVDAPDALDACIQCPLCWTMTCAECRAPWHEVWTCAEAKRIRADAAAIGSLAKENRWMPCPTCHAVIEKSEGCNHISCICGEDFCYWCGVAYLPDGRGCDCGLLDDTEGELPANRLTEALTAANRTPAAIAGPIPLEVPLRIRVSGGRVYGQVNIHGDFPRGVSPMITGMFYRNKCPYSSCSRAFSTRTALMQHLSSVRSHPVWICCGRIFMNADAYCRHHRRTEKHFEYKEPKMHASVARPGHRCSRKHAALLSDEDYYDWDDEFYIDDDT